MQSNTFNRNQHLHLDPVYQGVAVQSDKGPLIEENLARTLGCFSRALEKYPRVWAMRVDLHIPENYMLSGLNDNSLIERFISSLRSKIKSSQRRSQKLGHRVHETDVRHIWARELTTNGRVHYHVILLLNHDAYAHIGKFDLDSDNMYSRIHQAWASALCVCVNDLIGLVHFPQNATYSILRNETSTLNDPFFRASYLSKVDTKEFQKGFHTFGCSRI